MNKRPGLFSDVSDLSPSAGKRKRVKSSSTGVSVREMKELVGELRPEDGVDPRYAAKKRRRASSEARPGFTHGVHKQEQLLSQVESALDSALQCAATPILNELAVVEVVQDGGSLLVVVGPRNPEERADVQAATLALEKATSMLKREVASSITRKEAPVLKFMVLPAAAKKTQG